MSVIVRVYCMFKYFAACTEYKLEFSFQGTSLKTELPVQTALLSKEEWANEEMHRYYEKYCLDRLEEKIGYRFRDKSFILQAVTHSSFCQNKVSFNKILFSSDN